MPICPVCKQKINYLIEKTTGVQTSTLSLNKSGGIDYENKEFEGDGDYDEFFCPECNEELDFDYEEAEQFLKDKDELQEIVAEKLNKIKEENK